MIKFIFLFLFLCFFIGEIIDLDFIFNVIVWGRRVCVCINLNKNLYILIFVKVFILMFNLGELFFRK